jgi:hypothetical protein
VFWKPFNRTLTYCHSMIEYRNSAHTRCVIVGCMLIATGGPRRVCEYLVDVSRRRLFLSYNSTRFKSRFLGAAGVWAKTAQEDACRPG